ncbi:MAG TPA: TIGR03435 family protein [Vicinamibacterales bacterium]|jgi:uncharacterized protein (TIGR03435 family)|nr:TIGR03435 family protein [Vicinamibacterales bacterium]
MRTALAVGIVCALASVAGHAQRATFDITSIHPSQPDAKTRVEVRGDRFIATSVTLLDLVKLAYPSGNLVRSDEQVAGGLSWVRSARYDIVATGAPTSPDLQTVPGAVAPRSGPALKDAQQKLQALLADRFHLVVHNETRELPVYTLVRTDPSALGPRLQAAAACERDGSRDASGAACGGFSLDGPGMAARSVTMAMLASVLSNLPAVGRTVVDDTALTGNYDLSISYSRPAATGTDLGGPSIFTAVQEQLGLKLQPSRVPMEVVVIDSAAIPAAN